MILNTPITCMEEKKTYKLTISYDGTNYSGWQIQPHSPSIQELIKKALSTILREEITLIGSGRTDAGVHAIGQVAHFRTAKEFSLKTLHFALNCMLPKDIRIMDFEPIDSTFHAQYSAIGKIYHYNLWLDDIVDPTKRLFTHHVQGPFDLNLLHESAKLFLGKNDFSSFANSASEGSASKNPIRTLKRLESVTQEGGIRLEFEGDGFLYKMVRNIMGTLLDVSSKKRSIDDIPLIFSSKDRRLCSRAAPAQGLFLFKVLYYSCYAQN